MAVEAVSSLVTEVVTTATTAPLLEPQTCATEPQHTGAMPSAGFGAHSESETDGLNGEVRSASSSSISSDNKISEGRCPSPQKDEVPHASPSSERQPACRDNVAPAANDLTVTTTFQAFAAVDNDVLPTPVLVASEDLVGSATPRLDLSAAKPSSGSSSGGARDQQRSVESLDSVDLVRCWEHLQSATLSMAEDVQVFLAAASKGTHQLSDSSAPQPVLPSSDSSQGTGGGSLELEVALDQMRATLCQLSTLPRWRRGLDGDLVPSAASTGQTKGTDEVMGGSDEEADPISLLFIPPVTEQQCREGAKALLMAQVSACRIDLKLRDLYTSAKLINSF